MHSKPVETRILTELSVTHVMTFVSRCQAIQGSPAGAQGQLTQELSHEERQFEEYKKTAVRRLERVKSKVWRDHKRMSEMRREFDRLHEQVICLC